MSIDIPIIIDQFQNVPIRIISNGTGVNGTTIIYDNTTIGTTDNNGNLSYTFVENGSHTISASKIGYVGISRDIDIRAPFSEFKAQDMNIIPNSTFTGDKIKIISNITNSGTKGDTKSVELVVNGTVVDNISVMLEPKETKEINFTHKVSLPQGNYTVEILDQSKLIEVKKSSISTILIVAAITIIGIIVVYMATTKKGKEQIMLSRDTIRKLIKR